MAMTLCSGMVLQVGLRAEGGSVGIRWVKVAMKPERDLLYTGFVRQINLQHGENLKATTVHFHPNPNHIVVTSMTLQRYVKGGFYSQDY